MGLIHFMPQFSRTSHLTKGSPCIEGGNVISGHLEIG